MARQAQLVSQHLENISHEALSKYQPNKIEIRKK